jgi:class 3 adenylate cyclase
MITRLLCICCEEPKAAKRAPRKRVKVGSRSARPQYAHAVAETPYASCGDLSLAYQVFGDGPVLFTDIVASTAHAAATGDERWRAVLQRFGEITADLAQRFGGTVVKSTGDGHLATFDGPTQAIRCAEALRADAETVGVDIRAGIHTGECELLDADIGGIAVHIAARICGQAGAGEILVSRTVRDLVVGSGTGFEDRGSVELRGVPGTWQLLAVDRHGAGAGSAEAELASMPTPGRRTAMRRSDRAVEVIARRTPWIVRGMARLAPATGRSGTTRVSALNRPVP